MLYIIIHTHSKKSTSHIIMESIANLQLFFQYPHAADRLFFNYTGLLLNWHPLLASLVVHDEGSKLEVDMLPLSKELFSWLRNLFFIEADSIEKKHVKYI